MVGVRDITEHKGGITVRHKTGVIVRTQHVLEVTDRTQVCITEHNTKPGSQTKHNAKLESQSDTRLRS